MLNLRLLRLAAQDVRRNRPRMAVVSFHHCVITYIQNNGITKRPVAGLINSNHIGVYWKMCEETRPAKREGKRTRHCPWRDERLVSFLIFNCGFGARFVSLLCYMCMYASDVYRALSNLIVQEMWRKRVHPFRAKTTFGRGRNTTVRYARLLNVITCH